MNISKNIFAIRNEKRLTQNEVALRMGIDQPNYARLEKRDVELSIKQLSEIAVALGVTVDDILHYGEEKPQIVDNEKVKELERQILEKDLEINRSRYEMKMNEIKSSVIRILRKQNFIYNIVEACVYSGRLSFCINDIIASCFKTELGKEIFYLDLCINKLDEITPYQMVEGLVSEVKRTRKKDDLFTLLDTNVYEDIFRKELDETCVEIKLNFKFSKSDYEKLKLYEEERLYNFSGLQEIKIDELYQTHTPYAIDTFNIRHFVKDSYSIKVPSGNFLFQRSFFRISIDDLQKLIDENRIK